MAQVLPEESFRVKSGLVTPLLKYPKWLCISIERETKTEKLRLGEIELNIKAGNKMLTWFSSPRCSSHGLQWLHDLVPSWTSTSKLPALILFQPLQLPCPSSKVPGRLLTQDLGHSFCLSLECSFPRFHMAQSLLSLPLCQISGRPSLNTQHKIALLAPALPIYFTPFIAFITISCTTYLHVYLFTVCNLKVSSVRT